MGPTGLDGFKLEGYLGDDLRHCKLTRPHRPYPTDRKCSVARETS